MPPRKKYDDIYREQPTPLVKAGPPEGTVARNLWLEQQAGLLADAIKEKVKLADPENAVALTFSLMNVVTELYSARTGK